MAGKRRARGEGGLYQRADGRWEGVVDLGYGPGGKRLRRKVVAATRAQANERLKRLREEVEKGLSPDHAKTTIGDWLEQWLRDAAPASARPRTLLAYASVVRTHLVPALGHKRLRALSPDDISDYMNRKTAAGLKPRTVTNHHIVLRRALEIATRYGYVEKNVARLVSPPRADRFESTPLTPDEARQFLKAAEGHPLEALFLLATASGLRQAEVLGLTWQAIDFDGEAIKVEKALARYGGEFHLDQPKTESSRRVVALPSRVFEALRRHRVRQAEQQLAVGPLWTGNKWGLVFATDDGSPIHDRYVREQFHRLLDSAGVRRVRFHDLRHGLATFLLAQGASMKVVQDVLGHAQIGMTMNLYTHVVPELRRDAANKVDDVLFGAG